RRRHQACAARRRARDVPATRDTRASGAHARHSHPDRHRAVRLPAHSGARRHRADRLSGRGDLRACPRRQSAVQSHPVRHLSRPLDLGRPVFAAPARAGADPAPPAHAVTWSRLMPAPAVAVSQSEFVITRVFDAPRELVWQAWTEPKHMAAWFGPETFTIPV